MTGFTDKIKELGKSAKHSSSKKAENHSSESHTSTVTPVHQNLLPSEATQPQVGGGYGSQGHTGPSSKPHAQTPSTFTPTSGGASDMESYEHVSAPRDHHTTSQVTPSGPNTPQLSPRLPKESASQPPSATAGAQALGVQYEEAPPASTISHDTSSKLAASNAAPGGPTYEPSLEQRATPTFEPRAQEQMVPSGISHDTSSRLAASTGAPGGPTFEPLAQEQTAPASGIGPDMSSRLAGSTGAPGGPTFEFGTNEHGGLSEGQQRVAGASPNVSDLGASNGFNRPGDSSRSETDKASIGEGDVNASNTATNTPSTGLANNQPQGYVQQAQETAAPYVAKVQETAAPYVAKVQETAAPYVAKAQETVGPYVSQAQEAVGPYVAQAQEAASPYVAKARDLGSSAIESARPAVAQAANSAGNAASSAYNTAAAELDARGVNMENTKQKLADAGRAAKDYGTVGQQRAGEYLQQAVDQAKNMDGENKSIVASILGTVVLVWLAFGFSLVAMLALGVAGTIAALLARFSSKRVSSNTPGTAPGFATPPSHTQTTSAPKQTQTPGVETHYPRPSHPTTL